jgi:hypothetical protein
MCHVWISECDRFPAEGKEVYLLLVDADQNLGYGKGRLSPQSWEFTQTPPGHCHRVLAWLESDGSILSEQQLRHIPKDRIRSSYSF